MVFDRSDEEPDEYDPEEEFRDPDSDSITIPKVPTENAGSGLRSELQSDSGDQELTSPGPSVEEADVPSELARDFWALVLVINGAVLAYALAVMFLVFEGETTYSSYLLVAGVVLTVSAARRYRAAKRTDYGTVVESNRDDGVTDDDVDGAETNTADTTERDGDATDRTEDETNDDGENVDR